MESCVVPLEVLLYDGRYREVDVHHSNIELVKDGN